MNDLVKFWQEMSFDKKPYIHPKDELFILKSKKRSPNLNYNDCIQSKTIWREDDYLQVNLLPMPYAGNLEEASIFILMLNPGFKYTEYFFEAPNTRFFEAMKQNIRQEGLSENYPFQFLNPEFLTHPGGQYWLKRLNVYIKEVMIQKELSFGNALKYISKKFAVLELMPYHSESFGSPSLLKKLKSVDAIKKFVNGPLLEKVSQSDACIICTRQAKEWCLKSEKGSASENVIVYPPKYARSGHIGLKSPASNIIFKFLKLEHNGKYDKKNKETGL